MKEEEWFSKGVVLSDPCNVSIVDNSLEKLELLRMTGTRHQIIAVACSINHAQRIRSLYKERGYTADIIHSQMDTDKQQAVLRDLKNGVLDCIVQVAMLGEGFDHPKLSVAASSGRSGHSRPISSSSGEYSGLLLRMTRHILTTMVMSSRTSA